MTKKFQRIRQQQILREAEGYLDLVMVLSDRWPLPAEERDCLTRRALRTMERIQFTGLRRAHACYLEGQAYLTSQRYRKALQALDEAAELDPENIHIWLAAAWCHKRIGRLDLAIQDLEEALVVDNSEAIVHYNLACYWSLAENSKLAITYLARALEIDPDYRDLIAGEPDFDPIRKDPEFQMLTSVIV